MKADDGILTIYLSSDFARATEVNSLARRLELVQSVRVVSRWHQIIDTVEAAAGMGGPADPSVARTVGERNLNDIDACDVFVLLTTGAQSRGGRHFETGYAFARNKRIVIAGDNEHAFHHLRGVTTVAVDQIEHVLSLASSDPRYDLSLGY